MSRRRVCYWPGQTDWGRDWLFLNLGVSDDDLSSPQYSPTPSRYSPPRYCTTPSRYSPTRVSPTPSSCCCSYHRPWRYTPAAKSGFSKIQHDNGAFKVTLDVKHFKDGDLKVKIVGNEVVVEAQHDEREDEFGYISRSLKRKYALPAGVDIDNVKTELSSDGILTIFAPKKIEKVEGGKERLIPILKVSKPALISKKKDDEKAKSTKAKDVVATGDDNDDDDDDDDAVNADDDVD